MKKNAKGEVKRYKARPVTKGIDFEDVFATIVRVETIRLNISFVAQKKILSNECEVNIFFMFLIEKKEFVWRNSHCES